jgi:hypothetical protein
VSEERYLLYVWTPSGYELEEREGEPPAAGAELVVRDARQIVSKVADSPLPDDPRPCAYLQPV